MIREKERKSIILMLGICTVLSVAASSVEWRCSTEGSTWQLEALPTQNRDHDEAPNPICNPIPMDCWGKLNQKKMDNFLIVVMSFCFMDLVSMS